MVQCRCVEAFFLFLPTLLYSEQTFPIINKRGAQSSIVSFPHALITQWYSNEEHVIFSQPFLAAASFHSLTL